MPRSLESSEPVELPFELQWHYEKQPTCTGNGPYMIAAPAFSCYTHHPVRRSVPCYRRLKGCTLDCPFCRWKTQFSTYVFYFDPRDKKFPRKCCCGGKKTWEDVGKIPVGHWFSISKGNHTRDTIRLRPWHGSVDDLLSKVWRGRVVEDNSAYLFHLWQRRELTEHFGHTYYASLAVQANAVRLPDLTGDDAIRIPD